MTFKRKKKSLLKRQTFVVRGANEIRHAMILKCSCLFRNLQIKEERLTEGGLQSRRDKGSNLLPQRQGGLPNTYRRTVQTNNHRPATGLAACTALESTSIRSHRHT